MRSGTATIKANGQRARCFQANDLDVEVTHTVSFVMSPNQGTRTYAIVNFAVGGNQTVRKFDVTHGVSISGPGGIIAVEIEDASEFKFNEYEVTAIVAPGTRFGGSGPLTFTPVPVGQLIKADESIVVPYANVGEHTVMCRAWNSSGPFYGTTVFVQFTDGTGAISDQFPCDGKFVTIPSGTTKIEVFNGSELDVNVRVSFGIDG